MGDEIIEMLEKKFGDAVLSSSAGQRGPTAVVDGDKWPAIAKWFATETGFTFLSDLCGMDYLGREGDRFEVVYHLTDLENPKRMRVRVPVADGDPPKIKTVTDIWPTADWMEREAFDMFGIVFEGHSDLRRILMPDEWEGFPLRKDYAVGKVPVEYKHLSPGYS